MSTSSAVRASPEPEHYVELVIEITRRAQMDRAIPSYRRDAALFLKTVLGNYEQDGDPVESVLRELRRRWGKE